MASQIKIQILIRKFDKTLGEIIHEDLKLLKDIKWYVIKSGGKRIRPLTHYFISQLLGYNGNDLFIVGAVSELIHSASLLHDDVVDGAEMRRGNHTIGKLYGNKTAILSGDFLLACGIERLNRLQNPKLLDSFTRVIRDLSVGELIQMEWEKNPKITLKIYEKIIYGKTASLFGAVCETAGILANRNKDQVRELHEFGVSMGMLFQIKDDYIDYFDSGKKSGKKILKDFSNGLYTHPLIILHEFTTQKENIELNKMLMKEEKTQEDFGRIMSLLEKYTIQEKIRKNIENSAKKLILFLSRFAISDARDLMIQRIDLLAKD
ncbi:MAG: polyprenyl synthetase family protein [Leptospira sp.]|nr:polyprenyl synthetase family protein [Leptospira sp.]